MICKSKVVIECGGVACVVSRYTGQVSCNDRSVFILSTQVTGRTAFSSWAASDDAASRLCLFALPDGMDSQRMLPYVWRVPSAMIVSTNMSRTNDAVIGRSPKPSTWPCRSCLRLSRLVSVIAYNSLCLVDVHLLVPRAVSNQILFK